MRLTTPDGRAVLDYMTKKPADGPTPVDVMEKLSTEFRATK